MLAASADLTHFAGAVLQNHAILFRRARFPQWPPATSEISVPDQCFIWSHDTTTLVRWLVVSYYRLPLTLRRLSPDFFCSYNAILC